MMEFIVPFIIGVVLIVLGISNMRGNISSLHFYHRNRVKEQDRLPFGKLVGLGTIIIGIALILMGALNFVASLLQNDLFIIIGSVILVIGLVIGLAISFYAMKKYNGGIF